MAEVVPCQNAPPNDRLVWDNFMNMPFLSELVWKWFNKTFRNTIRVANSLDPDQGRHKFAILLNLDFSHECPQPLSMSVQNVRVLGIIINGFCEIKFN